MTNDTIRTITQSILAIVIVAGVIIFAYFKPDSSALTGLIGVLGGVVSYYFLSATQTQTAKTVAAETVAQMMNQSAIKK